MPRDIPGGDSMVHVVGAGLAGLSAAMALVEAGRRVTVHESGPQAGGRCRSYFDRELGCRLDNGNHLLLSGNRESWAFMDRIGTRDTMGGPASALFPFIDVATGERWTVRPNAGRVPWWVLSPRRRVPGAGLREFAALLALRRASPTATVAEMLPRGELSRRLLEPLAIAALNTPLATGSARLLGRIMDESLSRGGRACVPAYPREGLS
ncbi:MAG: hydroxysqualene dehydroxylase, partial [Janthinobacterium lividum]